MEHNNLKIFTGKEYFLEFQFDECKEGESEYGTYHRYAFKHEGQDTALFATDTLHAKLAGFRKGDKIKLVKDEYEPGKFAWIVEMVGKPVEMPTGQPQPKLQEPSTNDRIARAVAFKEACKMFYDLGGEKLSSDDLVILSYNTDALLEVLENRLPEDELPF